MGGGTSEPPLAARCHSHMLGCTGNAEPHPAPVRDPRSEGGTLPQSHPTSASPLVFPRGSSGPRRSSHDDETPARPSKLLNPRHSSTQHPSPGPDFLSAQPPRGCWRSGSPRWHSAPMQISASSAGSSQRSTTGYATARVYVRPAAHQRCWQWSWALGSATRGWSPKYSPSSNIKHDTSLILVLPAAPAPRGWAGKWHVLPALPSWSGEAPRDGSCCCGCRSVMSHAPQGCSLLPWSSPQCFSGVQGGLAAAGVQPPAHSTLLGHRIYMLWERATAQGHTTNTGAPDTQGTPHSGRGHSCCCCCYYNPSSLSPQLRTVGPPSHRHRDLACSSLPRSPGCWRAPAVHTSSAGTQATLAPTPAAPTHAAARTEGWRPVPWLLGWSGSSFRLPAPVQTLSLRWVSRRVLPRRGGAVRPRELGAPFARQVSLTPQLPATPSPSCFERRKLIFLDHAGASSPWPRSCEQFHPCLASYTRIAAVKLRYLLCLGLTLRLSPEFTAKAMQEHFCNFGTPSTARQEQRGHRCSMPSILGIALWPHAPELTPAPCASVGPAAHRAGLSLSLSPSQRGGCSDMLGNSSSPSPASTSQLCDLTGTVSLFCS